MLILLAKSESVGEVSQRRWWLAVDQLGERYEEARVSGSQSVHATTTTSAVVVGSRAIGSGSDSRRIGPLPIVRGPDDMVRELRGTLEGLGARTDAVTWEK